MTVRFALRLLLPRQLPADQTKMARPLRSTRITRLHHYYGSVRRCIAPARYSAPCGSCRLGFSLSLQVRHWPVPSQRLGCSFPRSTLAPEPGSRRLCAGCHLGSKQVSPRLVPSTKASSVSTSLIGLSTRSSTVYLIRLPD